jgi:hypothetical protein
MDFRLPEAAERDCAGALCSERRQLSLPPERVFGPVGTHCPRCGEHAERDEWKRWVAERYREAFESIPDDYRSARLTSPGPSALEATELALECARDAASAVFVGPSFAGKTWLACATMHERMARAAIVTFPRQDEELSRQDARVYALASSRYVRAFAFGSVPPWDNSIAALRRAAILVLDDLGLEPTAATALVADVLIERCDMHRQTLVTTSLDPEAVGHRYGEGVLRRLSSRKWIRPA